MEINFAPVFDVGYYRKVHPELSIFPDNVIIEHHERYAEKMGLSTCAYDRRESLHAILNNVIHSHSLEALEISPNWAPFISGNTVQYFSLFSIDELKELARKEGREAFLPQKIDYIDPKGNLGVIKEKFDIVFSSHVVEHCPDLVLHFNAVSDILKENGLYVLIVPDKRYCFDHYNSETSLSDVIDAFASKRIEPSLSSVISTSFLRTHNNPMRHWLGDHGLQYGRREENERAYLSRDVDVELNGSHFGYKRQGESAKDFMALADAYYATSGAGEYINSHCWQFNPRNFQYIVEVLRKLGFINLSPYRICNTLWGRFEFIGILKKLA